MTNWHRQPRIAGHPFWCDCEECEAVTRAAAAKRKADATKRATDATAALEEMVKLLNAEFPQAGLTFGYLGNLTAWCDDRAWYVFTQLWTPDGRKAKWGAFSTERLPEMLKEAQAGKLRAYVERLLSHRNNENAHGKAD